MERELDDAVPGSLDARRARQQLQALFDARRARHGVLAHQDAIGLGIFGASCAAVIGAAVAYAYGLVPAWLVVLWSAFFMSLLHELEHDLIHRLYFKTRPWIAQLMMLGVWLLRPSTVSPWVRRDWHLHHHRASGTQTDLEERGITNGEPWGLRRLLMTLDGILAIVLRPRATREMLLGYAAAQKPASKRAYKGILWRNRLSYAPLGNLHFALWHAFLLIHGTQWATTTLGHTLRWPDLVQAVLPTVDFVVMVLLLPNVLRTFCLHFVSSNIHYYGDVEPKNVTQQTQVWTSPWLYPLQLFCFNFGGTHAIHHFVVQEPFYLRQLVGREAYPIMRAHGVRFDDYDALRRANRWLRERPASDVATPMHGVRAPG